MGTLPVIVEETVASDSNVQTFDAYRGGTLSGGGNDGGDRTHSKVKELSTDKLSASLQNIHGSLNELFGSIKEVGEFELQEVKLTLDVTAEGGFALIGSAKAGMKGGITLTFKPPKSDV